MPASDLMLVDFGRAVDLATLRRGVSDARLCGYSVAENDMACVAMRQGLEWNYDVDMFGICASAHVLLFSSHIHIVQDDVTQRWRLSSRLRRYWQGDLWHNLFDTLLNYQCKMGDTSDSTHANNSRNVLHILRVSIESHLLKHAKELDMMLKEQARRLPSKRLG